MTYQETILIESLAVLLMFFGISAILVLWVSRDGKEDDRS